MLSIVPCGVCGRSATVLVNNWLCVVLRDSGRPGEVVFTCPDVGIMYVREAGLEFTCDEHDPDNEEDA